MPAKRYVFLDLGMDDLTVLIPAETGVVYQQQYGGTACMRGQAEGYLIPVHGAGMGGGGESLATLRDIFERELGGSGWPGGELPGPVMARLRDAVAKVPFCESGRTADDVLARIERPLEVDAARLDELDEAWLPVVTGDGPGFLLWRNSD